MGSWYRMNIQKKTVLVTGSTDGVGRLVARRLADQGARVLIHGRDRTRGKLTYITIRHRAAIVLRGYENAWQRPSRVRRLGRWHDTPVGPHTQSMYQIAFPPALLASFLPWLMLNRDGLSILLHPGTGDAYADHIEHAVWLGSALPLRLNVLRNSRKTPSHS